MKQISTQLSAMIGLGISAALLGACTQTSLNPSSLTTSSGQNIVNGTDATDAQTQQGGFANPVVSIQVILDQQQGEMALCTGTLINPQVVLTAGHCIEQATAKTEIIVTLHPLDGLKNVSAANSVTVKKFIGNPNYLKSAKSNSGKGQGDDLSLLLLTKPLPGSVTPATLVAENFDISSVSSLTAVGYGQSDDRHNATQDESGAGILRYMTIEGKNIELYSKAGDPLDGMLVADAQQSSVCHGDSGGPLLVDSKDGQAQTQIAGVNDMVLPVYSGVEETDYEAAMKQGEAGLNQFYQKYPDAHICLGYNVFVNVATHVAWINSTMKTLLQDK